MHLGIVREKIIASQILWAERLSKITWISRLVLHCPTTVSRKVTKSSLVMRGGRPAVDLPHAHIQCGIQRERAMPIVFESMPLDPPGRHRQDGI
jgi:hypothetical protein